MNQQSGLPGAGNVGKKEQDPVCSSVSCANAVCADMSGNEQGYLFGFPCLLLCCLHGNRKKGKKNPGEYSLTVPVLGFLMGIVSVFYAVPYTLTGKYPSEGGWLYAVDALFWIAVLIIYWKRDETVHLLRLDEPYRRLGKWERNFLHAAGVFLFVIGAMLMAVTQTGISGTAARVITGFGSPCVGVFGNVCGHFGMAGESERLLPVYDYDRRALSAG